MRTLGLDLGDRWVGVAVSDPLGITCKPYTTIEIDELVPFLKEVIEKEKISTIVIGHPKTCGGKQSQQTLKVEEIKQKLEELLIKTLGLTISLILWDERLSSKRAGQLQTSSKKPQDAEAKKKSHAVAAAFILQSYLDGQSLLRSFSE